MENKMGEDYLKKDFMKNRPYSWSQHSSFLYSPEEWYQSYVLGNKGPPSREILFGSYVDKRLQDDHVFLPHVPRYPVMQHEMKAKLKTLPLIGYADGWDPKNKILADYKTGKKPWTQKRADEHGQLTFYCLLLWLTEKINPEDVELRIHWLPTEEQGDYSITLKNVAPETFTTRRSMQEVASFINEIKRVRMAMANYSKLRKK